MAESVVYLNGTLVSARDAAVSVADRGFTYGDGIFEVAPFVNGKVFAWELHMARWKAAAEYLRLQAPIEGAELLKGVQALIAASHLSSGVLRLQLSRGQGPRGYSSRGAVNPTLVATAHPFPTPSKVVRLITSSHRLPPLSHFKTCNRLVNILAKDEAEAQGADEALFLNERGFVAEATSSNIFWLEGTTLCTPALSTGCLPGVTRHLLLELWGRTPRLELEAGVDRLREADAIFLSSSGIGVLEVASFDGREVGASCSVGDLRESYQLQLERGRP